MQNASELPQIASNDQVDTKVAIDPFDRPTDHWPEQIDAALDEAVADLVGWLA